MNIEKHNLWCDDDGHLNNDQAKVIMQLSKEQKPKYCLETGFCTGRSALSVILGNKDNIEKFITIDINFDYMPFGKSMLKKFESDCSFFRGIENNSKEILTKEFLDKEFPNGIDWFTVDGDHSYVGCTRDLQSALPYMNKNSIIIVDDYNSGPPNGHSIPVVTKACDDFYKENSDKVSIEKWNKLGKGLCIFRVK